MALPTIQRTWTYDTNNRITYTSLVQVMRELLFSYKEFLKLNGYTVVGSSDGTSADMAGSDFWVSATNAGIRGASAATVQSWIVLQAANGIRILMTYQGATDDVCRLSFSHNVYTLAGTPTHQPTTVDEQILTTTASHIGSETSGDRLWHGWVDSTDTMFRFAVARAGISRSCWGVEVSEDKTDPGSITWDGTWGWHGTSATSGFFGAASSINQLILYAAAGVSTKVARPLVSSTPINCQCFLGVETYGADGTLWMNVQPELQGVLGYPIRPLFLGSNTTGGRGKLAHLYDWWAGRSTGSNANDADVYGANQFIQLAGTSGLVWPWDGSVPIWI